MALKFSKKIAYTKINAKVEDSVAQALDQFVSFVVKREGDHINKDLVIQELLREYLAGTSADVRQWREQLNCEQVSAPTQSASPSRSASAEKTQSAIKDLSAQVDQALNLGKEERVKPALPVGRERLEAEQQRIKNERENKSQASPIPSGPGSDASAS